MYSNKSYFELKWLCVCYNSNERCEIIMTTLYLIRHSKPLKVNNNSNKDSLQIQNEKLSLSVEGENIAREKMNNKELSNIDIIYSSNYVRTIQTAKYLAKKNNLEINVDSELGERKLEKILGINYQKDLKKDKQ